MSNDDRTEVDLDEKHADHVAALTQAHNRLTMLINELNGELDKLADTDVDTSVGEALSMQLDEVRRAAHDAMNDAVTQRERARRDAVLELFPTDAADCDWDTLCEAIDRVRDGNCDRSDVRLIVRMAWALHENDEACRCDDATGLTPNGERECGSAECIMPDENYYGVGRLVQRIRSDREDDVVGLIRLLFGSAAADNALAAIAAAQPLARQRVDPPQRIVLDDSE